MVVPFGEWYVIDCCVKDSETNEVISDSRFNGHWRSRDDAEEYISGRVSVKNTNTFEEYRICSLEEGQDDREDYGHIVCVWQVCPFRRRSDGLYTMYIHIISDDLIGYIP